MRDHSSYIFSHVILVQFPHLTPLCLPRLGGFFFQRKETFGNDLLSTTLGHKLSSALHAIKVSFFQNSAYLVFFKFFSNSWCWIITVWVTDIGPNCRPNISGWNQSFWAQIQILWQNSQASIVTVEIRIKTFIVKNPNMGCFLCVPYSGTLVHKQIREVP